MDKKTVHARCIFYFITFLSILMFAVGLTVDNSLSDNIGTFIGLQKEYFGFADYLILFSFCIWAWLIIVGVLFIKKNWIVVSICISLLIPHIIVIAVTYSYSYSVFYILKMYLVIFSFGFIRI